MNRITAALVRDDWDERLSRLDVDEQIAREADETERARAAHTVNHAVCPQCAGWRHRDEGSSTRGDYDYPYVAG